jgi:hypothetical protein
MVLSGRDADGCSFAVLFCSVVLQCCFAVLE